MISTKKIMAAATAMNPSLFSDDAHVAHMEASPLRVEIAKGKVMDMARIALEAAESVGLDEPAEPLGRAGHID